MADISDVQWLPPVRGCPATEWERMRRHLADAIECGDRVKIAMCIEWAQQDVARAELGVLLAELDGVAGFDGT